MRRAPRTSSPVGILGLALACWLLHADATSASDFERPLGDWLERPPPVPAPPPVLRTAGSFSHGAAKHLAQAFDAAVRQLRQHAGCRALFDDLDGDGEQLLGRSLYVRAKPHQESQVCRGRVAAFTGVGSPVTRLCRSFRRLDAEQGALILLHEALHFAGLGEAPHERGAPTSGEINDRVASACGL